MDILDETNEMYDRREGGRPVFITVLCILTWVGSFLGLISALFQVYTYSMMKSLTTSFAQAGMQDSSSYGYLFWIAMAGILGSILCSLGAVFMFRLKKFGFFIYLPGQLIPMAGSIYSTFIISSAVPLARSFGMIGAGIGLLFPIAFIIMYGVNLKHMK